MAERLWFFEIVVGIVVLIGVNYVFKKIIKHVRHRSLSVAHDWKGKLDQIAYFPFQILLWVLGATLVVEVLGRRFGFSFFEQYINSFRSTGFVLCAAWMLLRWKSVVQRDLMNKHSHMDTGFLDFANKIISVVVLGISLMFILQIWGLNIGPLIAFGGIGAAAIGFAGKDVIANLCSGIMLDINRPFVIGDTVVLPSYQLEGTIEEIGWSLTTVRDKEKRPVYLPNSIFSQVQVINASRMTHRRIEETIGLSYEDFPRIPELVDKMKGAIESHPDIDTHLPILVVLKGFNLHSIDVYIDVYTLQTRYEKFWQVKHEVLMAVYNELVKAGAKMPTPALSISGKLDGQSAAHLFKNHFVTPQQT